MKRHVALAALAITSLPGCFMELNGGIFNVSATSPSSQNDPVSKGGYNIGFNIGVAYDIERKTRVALVGGVEGLLIKTQSGQSGSSTASGIGARVDYSVMDLGSDDTKLRATGGLLYGTSKKVTVGGNSVDSSSYLDLYAGGTIALYSGSSSSTMLTVGPKYIHSSGDYGSVTGVGLHAALTYTFMPFGGSGGGGNDDDTVNGMWAIRSELPDDSFVIPALAVGARNAGCTSAIDGNAMAADCGGSKVGAVQKGNVVVRLCDKGISLSACHSLWDRILNATPVGN